MNEDHRNLALLVRFKKGQSRTLARLSWLEESAHAPSSGSLRETIERSGYVSAERISCAGNDTVIAPQRIIEQQSWGFSRAFGAGQWAQHSSHSKRHSLWYANLLVRRRVESMRHQRHAYAMGSMFTHKVRRSSVGWDQLVEVTGLPRKTVINDRYLSRSLRRCEG